MWFLGQTQTASQSVHQFLQELTVVTHAQTDVPVPLYITKYVAIVRICAVNAMPAKRQFLADYVFFSKLYTIAVPGAVA